MLNPLPRLSLHVSPLHVGNSTTAGQAVCLSLSLVNGGHFCISVLRNDNPLAAILAGTGTSPFSYTLQALRTSDGALLFAESSSFSGALSWNATYHFPASDIGPGRNFEMVL